MLTAVLCAFVVAQDPATSPPPPPPVEEPSTPASSSTPLSSSSPSSPSSEAPGLEVRPPDSSLATPAGPDWSSGVGLSGFLVGDGFVDTVSVSVERRLTPSVWVIGRAGASLSSSSASGVDDDDDDNDIVTDAFNARIGVAGGVRWYLYDGLVRPSLHVLGGPFIGTQDETRAESALDDAGEPTTSTTVSNVLDYGVDVTGGFAVDVPFAQVLSLRLATDVVGVGARASSATFQVDDEDERSSRSSSLGAAVFLAPSIELRVFF